MELRADRILILDFGSQYTQLIARRVRELSVYCEIHPFDMTAEAIRRFAPRGIVLSGGPASVHAEGSPRCAPEVFSLGVPVLGICYGLQLMAHSLGGKVLPAKEREYGPATIEVVEPLGPLAGFEAGEQVPVWMSHGDRVESLPAGFRSLARTPSAPHACVADPDRRFFAVQFHPEVVHSPRGQEMLRAFLFETCGLGGGWTMGRFADESVQAIRAKVGSERVVCGLSGGVDSAVCAMLVHRAIGDQLHCIFVDNGLLRDGEIEEVERVFGDRFHIPLTTVRAGERFLGKLAGVSDPEQKRKIIGREFIAVFEEAARGIERVSFLAQGTLYPDVIESVSTRGPSATIKSHHNVGGLPERMQLKLLEPLRELFKDEVRALGRELGLPESVLARHPFPGPGLAIRVLGAVSPERLAVLRRADRILRDEITAAGLDSKVWQVFCVLLPVQTVGVMGDERTYENALAVRAVESVDGMTADWARLPYEVLGRISSRIINEVRGINRVVYDISSKPPATIEWE